MWRAKVPGFSRSISSVKGFFLVFLKAGGDGGLWRFITHVALAGSDFQCNTHIIPVKNQEGVVMMFILNFDHVLDEENSNSLERLNLTPHAKSEI
ncbi:hypothetical protein cypCar_00045243, partial [Cyprinus carpio]